MLKKLFIKNIAIIDEIEIEFDKGLTILTGETGAGKSIIVDSLILLTGGKASKEIIRNGCDKALVSALIEIENNDIINNIFEKGISFEDNYLYITREISISGKSICKINNQYVPLNTLKSIMKDLIEIHGQNENILLNDNLVQLNLIDRYVHNQLLEIYDKYKILYNEYISLIEKINEIQNNQRDKDKRLDFINYQIQEIQSANLNDIEEDKKLEQKRIFLQNSVKLRINIEKAYSILSRGVGNSKSVLDMIAFANKLISEISDFDVELRGIKTRMENISFEIEDVCEILSKIIEKTYFEQGELDYIIERLDQINKLKKKYGNTLRDIINYKEELLGEKEILENCYFELENLNKKINEVQKQINEMAEKISNIRKDGAKRFIQEINNHFKELDLNNAVFDIIFEKKQLDNSGIDKVEYVISTNIGQELKPLNKIASGGELSRIMLAIKSVIGEKDNVILMVFDEVDNGISGETGIKLAKLLRKISKNRQVICVTHLPQVAACSHIHYKVFKMVINNNTFAKVKKLSKDECVEEIARMIAGNIKSDYSLNHAKELINVLSEE